MSKKQKKLHALLSGGIGANVVDGDLGLAISIWKQELKKSGILNELYSRRNFTKPSILKKNILSSAKHKQKIQTFKEKIK